MALYMKYALLESISAFKFIVEAPTQYDNELAIGFFQPSHGDCRKLAVLNEVLCLATATYTPSW